MNTTGGLCECGCGEQAPLAKQSSARFGWVKGQPVRFILGHSSRLQRRPAHTCEAPGCEQLAKRGRCCSMHLSRLWRYNSFDIPPKPTLEQVFWSNVEMTKTCWLWTGALTFDYYGRLRTGNRRGYVLAHRYSYELLVGPIASGMVIDHVCHNRDGRCPGLDRCLHRRCVNPQHLEAVTNSVNVKRALVSRETCRKGHERTPENLLINASGNRVCLPCRREASREYAERRKTADRSLVPHGTLSGYNGWYCRCDECRAALAAYNRLRRLKAVTS